VRPRRLTVAALPVLRVQKLDGSCAATHLPSPSKQHGGPLLVEQLGRVAGVVPEDAPQEPRVGTALLLGARQLRRVLTAGKAQPPIRDLCQPPRPRREEHLVPSMYQGGSKRQGASQLVGHPREVPEPCLEGAAPRLPP